MAAAAEIVGVSKFAVKRLKARGWQAYSTESRMRPMPADFAIQCDLMSQVELTSHYGTSREAVRRWCNQVDRSFVRTKAPVPKIPSPPFDDVVNAIAEKGLEGAAAHFAVHRNTLRRWRKELGLPVGPPRVAKLAVSHRGWADRYHQGASA